MSEKNRIFRRGSIEASTSERLARIVEAAEQAARKVIDDAEAEARRHLADAEAEADGLAAERIGALVESIDSLIAQAAAIRAQSEQLLASLEEARSQLGPEREGSPNPAAEGLENGSGGRGTHLSAVAPVEEQPEPTRESPAGARLLATQMAVSGNSREEIASRLRIGFEIEDTASILDAILGPED